MVSYKISDLEKIETFSKIPLYLLFEQWKINNSNELDHIIYCREGKEVYSLRFKDEDRTEAIRQAGRYAQNPDLSITWLGAANLSQQIGEIRKEESRGMNNRF